MLLYDDNPFIQRTRRALQALLPLAELDPGLSVFPRAHRGMLTHLAARWEESPDRDSATDRALTAARAILAVPDNDTVEPGQIRTLCAALAAMEKPVGW